MAFVTDYGAFWKAVETDVRGLRQGLSLPALNGPDGAGTGTIPVGQEFKPYQLDAPSVTVVPTGIEFFPAKRAGERDGTLAGVFTNGRALYLMQVQHEIWMWGDPDPGKQQPGYDFNSCVELLREVVGAMQRAAGGIPSIQLSAARFDQPTDVNRRGRMLVLPVSFWAPIVDEPYILEPFATSTTPGVHIAATLEEVFNDGSSTIAGIINAPPP